MGNILFRAWCPKRICNESSPSSRLLRGGGRPGGLSAPAPGTELVGGGTGPERGGRKKPPRASSHRHLRPEPSSRPVRDLTKRPPGPARAPSPRASATGPPGSLSASPGPAWVPAGPHRRFSRGLLRAAPPAPRPLPPAGHAHPEDEVEKHQHGLGGGDAALAHGAGGRLRPCSASGTRSPSEASMATAPSLWELHGLRSVHRSPRSRRPPLAQQAPRSSAQPPQSPPRHRATPRQPSPAPGQAASANHSRGSTAKPRLLKETKAQCPSWPLAALGCRRLLREVSEDQTQSPPTELRLLCQAYR